jgi:hypothetical protein
MPKAAQRDSTQAAAGERRWVECGYPLRKTFIASSLFRYVSSQRKADWYCKIDPRLGHAGWERR